MYITKAGRFYYIASGVSTYFDLTSSNVKGCWQLGMTLPF